MTKFTSEKTISIVCSGWMLLVLCAAGCRQGVLAGPGNETYSVETNAKQIEAGENQRVEIMVRYHRSKQPTSALKYKVQLSAPGDVTITPNTWNVQQNLASTDAGFNYTAAADIKVAPDAALGNRKVTVTIVPDRGKRTTRTLVYQVTEKRR